MTANRGTRVTCADLETGEEESVVITDNYVLVTDGDCIQSTTQHYLTTGTTVITIKRKEKS